jgi:hypothetical protein
MLPGHAAGRHTTTRSQGLAPVSRPKKPYIATLDQVRIRRSGHRAITEYIEPDVSTTSLDLGVPTSDGALGSSDRLRHLP